MYRIGFDVGGTFTDFTMINSRSGRMSHFKTPSTPEDRSQAIETGLSHFLNEYGVSPDDCAFIGHGTTVATNMVIERRGVLTGLITTRGARDVLEIGRQSRPQIYDYTVTKPEPLVDRWLRREVRERLDARGAVLVPMDEQDVREVAEDMRAAGVEAVAICFLNAYRDGRHEQRAAEIVREILPEAYISISSEVLPEFREFERFSTTVMNAYVGPRMAAYLTAFEGRLRSLGIGVEPRTIHSNGALMSLDAVRAFPVRTCLSGPAAGVVGAAKIAGAAGFDDIVTFDVGGTSTDVSLVRDGRPTFTTNRLVAHYPIRCPMMDIHVIGAGGGSIAALDDIGALSVGPRSAGSLPGPIAYGRGGTEPTVTDANLVLGRLSGDTLLSGRMRLDVEAAKRAIAQKIAEPMGLALEDAALGIIRIAVAKMGRAIRAVSTERGFRLDTFALCAYGGAGPLHACAVAQETGIRTVVVPAQPGTLCAQGILLSDVGFDFVKTGVATVGPAQWPQVAAAFAGMALHGLTWLDGEGVSTGDRVMRFSLDARYAGQNHEVQIDLADNPEISLEVFRVLFAEAHRREYGYDIDGRDVEIVNLRLSVSGGATTAPRKGYCAIDGDPVLGARPIYFTDGWYETVLYDRTRIPLDTIIEGPAIIQEMSSTTVLEPGQKLQVDHQGNIVIEVRNYAK